MQSQFKNFEDYLKYYHELKSKQGSQPLTATTDLGIWLNGKMVLYLANRKRGLFTIKPP
jgi:hypothetical protein